MLLVWVGDGTGPDVVVGLPVVVVVGSVADSVDEAEVVVSVAAVEVDVTVGLGTGVEVGAPEPFRKQYWYSSLNEHSAELLAPFREGFHWKRCDAVTSKKYCAALQSFTPGKPYCRSRPSTRLWQSLSVPGASGRTPGLTIGV